MKGDYADEVRHNHNAFLHHPHPFQLAGEYQASQEADSRSPGGTAERKESIGDGATIEVVRRRRGRPPGSKNRPKPPVFITREVEPAMSPHILEIPGGADVVQSLTRLSHNRSIGICVLSGSGAVVNVTLRQPTTTPGATVTFHGRFDILSLSATILPMSPATPPVAQEFTISLAGPHGQIFGGAVVAPLLAAETLYITAAAFGNSSFYRLPVEDEMQSAEEGESNEAVTGGRDGRQVPGAAESIDGMGDYGGQMATY